MKIHEDTRPDSLAGPAGSFARFPGEGLSEDPKRTGTAILPKTRPLLDALGPGGRWPGVGRPRVEDDSTCNAAGCPRRDLRSGRGSRPTGDAGASRDREVGESSGRSLATGPCL